MEKQPFFRFSRTRKILSFFVVPTTATLKRKAVCACVGETTFHPSLILSQLSPVGCQLSNDSEPPYVLSFEFVPRPKSVFQFSFSVKEFRFLLCFFSFNCCHCKCFFCLRDRAERTELRAACCVDKSKAKAREKRN